jgi:methionine aminopeptidase
LPGLAFPTCISINNTVSHFSPLPSDKDVPTLKDGDVVKVMLGVHIDGVSDAVGKAWCEMMAVAE